LNQCLSQTETIDDKDFESARLDGLQLQAEGAVLSARAESSKVQEARVVNDINLEKDAKIQELESKIARKQNEFNLKLKGLKEEQFMTSLRMRIRELKITADRLPSTSYGERQMLEATIATEERKSEDAWKIIVKDNEEEMNLQINVFLRDITKRSNEANQEVDFLRKEYESQLDEKNWREKACSWLIIGKRQISRKSK
jgi:hypothetical protein